MLSISEISLSMDWIVVLLSGLRAFTDQVQVVRDFYFHVVANALVLFDACIEFHEIVFFLHFQKFRHKAEHLERSSREQVDFLTGFQQRKFGCSQQTGTDKA